MTYDTIIIGAGLYGLYAALYCERKGEKVLVLEYDASSFSRATYINQARVHMGYHYPRSYSTAVKSAGYFEKFNNDYQECINGDFKKIYAISSSFSWTDARQFQKFCADANIPCDETSTGNYFKEGLCEGAFLTKEYTYDSEILKQNLMKSVTGNGRVDMVFDTRIETIKREATHYEIKTTTGAIYSTGFLINSTYASVNQILEKLEFPKFKIKYELCEIILCKPSKNLTELGITVMDGPFFSIMPFGKTGFHSLSAVTFTPHLTCYESLPVFECQKKSNGFCSTLQLGNCNNCPVKPETAWSYMSGLARKYLKEDVGFTYEKSLFSMKPILMVSEVDDSRPTVIRQFSSNPTFISVLSGKINTIYDLGEAIHDLK